MALNVKLVQEPFVCGVNGFDEFLNIVVSSILNGEFKQNDWSLGGADLLKNALTMKFQTDLDKTEYTLCANPTYFAKALQKTLQSNVDLEILHKLHQQRPTEELKGLFARGVVRAIIKWMMKTKKAIDITPDPHATLQEKLEHQYACEIYYKGLETHKPNTFPKKRDGDSQVKSNAKEERLLWLGLKPFFTGEYPVTFKSIDIGAISYSESDKIGPYYHRQDSYRKETLTNQDLFLHIGPKLAINKSFVVFGGQTYTLRKSLCNKDGHAFVSANNNKEALWIKYSFFPQDFLDIVDESHVLAKLFCAKCSEDEMYCPKCLTLETCLSNIFTLENE